MENIARNCPRSDSKGALSLDDLSASDGHVCGLKAAPMFQHKTALSGERKMRPDAAHNFAKIIKKQAWKEMKETQVSSFRGFRFRAVLRSPLSIVPSIDPGVTSTANTSLAPAFAAKIDLQQVGSQQM